MTEKEMKRLNRGELLEMLIIQMEENEELKKKLAETEKALADRRIQVEESGTLAEAVLRLNDVFEAADRAAAQYLENIRSRAEEGTDVHGQCGS